MEDIDYDPIRGLSRAVMQTLSSCQWVREHQNILLIGPTGTGKSFLAAALGHKACMEEFSACYLRLPRLFQELAIARGDGRYLKLIQKLSKSQVLILDDWGIAPMDDAHRRDLLEILDDKTSTGFNCGYKPASIKTLARFHRGSNPSRCDIRSLDP